MSHPFKSSLYLHLRRLLSIGLTNLLKLPIYAVVPTRNKIRNIRVSHIFTFLFTFCSFLHFFTDESKRLSCIFRAKQQRWIRCIFHSPYFDFSHLLSFLCADRNTIIDHAQQSWSRISVDSISMSVIITLHINLLKENIRKWHYYNKC